MTRWILHNPKYPPPKAGEPALHAAARVGDHGAIRALVEAGADIHEVFDMLLIPRNAPQEATPLMVAAGSGDGATVETVRLLLELGAEAKLRTASGTAATFACMGLGWNYRPGGDAARLELVLAAGCELPSELDERNSLLCDTARMGDPARLRVLLARGFEPRGYFDPEEARRRHVEIMRDMEKYKEGQPDFLAMFPEEMRGEIEESMKRNEEESFERVVSAPSHFGLPLFCAAESGDAECVRLLLEAGADPRARDSSDRSAMYYVGSREAADVLRAAGVPLEDEDEFGWSPLCGALLDSGEDGIARVRSLIEAGADVNAVHDRGYTVFMSAVGSEREPDVMRMLVEAGANPHAVSELGYNAFHAAIDVNGEANAEESVRSTLSYLKELGVDIELRNKAGETPLALAILKGRGVEVRVLCELGADPNAVCRMLRCGGDACGTVDLPLLFHAVDGSGVDRDEKTAALLEAGADPLVKDAEGFTPLQRVVAKLCADGAEYVESYRVFFRDVRQIVVEGDGPPSERREFMAQVTPAIRAYVEKFAAGIPVPETCEFDQEWRRERVECVVLLLVWEWWGKRAGGPGA